MSDTRRPLEPDDVRALLQGLERPRAPEDMVAKVRARLAAEKASGPSPAGAEVPPEAHPPWLSPSAPGAPEGTSPGRSPWRFLVEGGVLAAAAAAVVVGLWLGERVPRGGSPAAEAAGIGAASAVPEVELSAAVLDAESVRRLAGEAGLEPSEGPDGVAYEGDFRAVQRFLVSVRVEAARRGGEVQGFVPDAGRLKVRVRTR